MEVDLVLSKLLTKLRHCFTSMDQVHIDDCPLADHRKNDLPYWRVHDPLRKQQRSPFQNSNKGN